MNLLDPLGLRYAVAPKAAKQADVRKDTRTANRRQKPRNRKEDRRSHRRQRKNDRRDARQERITARQDGRSERKQTRQDGKSERVSTRRNARQDGKTDRAQIRNADGENFGDQVMEHLGGVQDIFGNLVEGIASGNAGMTAKVEPDTTQWMMLGGGLIAFAALAYLMVKQ